MGHRFFDTATLFILLLMSTRVSGVRLSKFAYIGCFTDNSTDRDMKGLAGLSQIGSYSDIWGIGAFSSNSMTLEMCSEICSLGSWPYFAVQNAKGCFCGNSYGKFGSVPDANCKDACGGNATQKCGAWDRNSVYSQTYLNDIKFAKASRVHLSVKAAFTQPSYWSVSVTDRIDCLVRCQLDKSKCQGVLYHQHEQPPRTCNLLVFSAVPVALSNTIAEFWIRT